MFRVYREGTEGNGTCVGSCLITLQDAIRHANEKGATRIEGPENQAWVWRRGEWLTPEEWMEDLVLWYNRLCSYRNWR